MTFEILGEAMWINGNVENRLSNIINKEADNGRKVIEEIYE